MTSAASARFAEVAAAAVRDAPNVRHRLVVDGDLEGFDRYEDAVAPLPATPIDDEREGSDMFCSLGTTGRPKGVRRPDKTRASRNEAGWSTESELPRLPTGKLYKRLLRERYWAGQAKRI